jgi:hypothetical protein
MCLVLTALHWNREPGFESRLGAGQLQAIRNQLRISQTNQNCCMQISQICSLETLLRKGQQQLWQKAKGCSAVRLPMRAMVGTRCSGAEATSALEKPPALSHFQLWNWKMAPSQQLEAALVHLAPAGL